jgi:hypothetical protein
MMASDLSATSGQLLVVADTDGLGSSEPDPSTKRL